MYLETPVRVTRSSHPQNERSSISSSSDTDPRWGPRDRDRPSTASWMLSHRYRFPLGFTPSGWDTPTAGLNRSTGSVDCILWTGKEVMKGIRAA